VGGVSERAGVKAGGSNPFAKTPSRVVAVEDILVVWKAALFAGRRRNEGLGRSVGGAGSSRSSGAPATADVRRTRGGERRRAYALQSVCTGTGTRNRRPRSGRRVLRSVLRPVRVDPHYARGAQSVFVVGRPLRHHGWANPREWEEPSLGLDGSDAARLAACHRFRKGEGVARREEEGGRGLRPCEEARVPVSLLARRVFVAEVCRRPLVSNKLGIRAPKRAVRVE